MFIKTFKELNYKDVGIAGGKGASLGEMWNTKMPVPPGFVVLAGVFERFLKESAHPRNGQLDLNVAVQAELDRVNYKDVNSVDRASNTIRDLIYDAEMPADLKKSYYGGI